MINYEMRCHGCGAMQPLDCFSPDPSRASGFHEVCKSCKAELARERRRAAATKVNKGRSRADTREVRGARLVW